MNTLKKLTLVVSLLLALSVSTLAGETSSPPDPCPNPGETSSPPCSNSSVAATDQDTQSITTTILEEVMIEATEWAVDCLVF